VARRVIICRCQEVSEEEIRQAVAGGARDVSGVKLRTRAGTGLCQGCICQPLIERLLARLLGCERSAIARHTSRPPARALEMGALAQPDERAAR